MSVALNIKGACSAAIKESRPLLSCTLANVSSPELPILMGETQYVYLSNHDRKEPITSSYYQHWSHHCAESLLMSILEAAAPLCRRFISSVMHLLVCLFLKSYHLYALGIIQRVSQLHIKH